MSMESGFGDMDIEGRVRKFGNMGIELMVRDLDFQGEFFIFLERVSLSYGFLWRGY